MSLHVQLWHRTKDAFVPTTEENLGPFTGLFNREGTTVREVIEGHCSTVVK